MIVGSIIEVSDAGNPASGSRNGAALITFYTMNEAITWAEIQSQNKPIDAFNTVCLCTVINTSTSIARWWMNGTEYTG
jgi:hypothetical protein